MNEVYYKNGSEVGFNMGEDYYSLLTRFKVLFSAAYLENNADMLIKTFKLEWSHCKAYFNTPDCLELVANIENKLRVINNLLLKNFPRNKVGEDLRFKRDKVIIDILEHAHNILYELQALKGMLQPKTEDPLTARRKYGD